MLRQKTKKNKNTRKNQKGGDILFPHVEEDFQFSLNKSIEKLFMTKQGNNYQLNLLDDYDYNDLVSLFEDGAKFGDKIVKPSPTYSYQDFNGKFGTNSPRYNIVELLFTQNINFSNFLQYLADKHPELFDKNNSRRMLFMASQYLNPTTEKLIEILEKKGILNDVLNPKDVTAYDQPILMLFSIDKNVIRFGIKKNRQPRIIELMELFISHGAKIDGRDTTGYNALMMASDRGYEQVVSYLLSINFDINSKHERTTLAYITPLNLAITNKHEDVVKILIEHKDPTNSISTKKLEEKAKDRNITLKMLELLGQEIENRKREALNDVVEQITGNDGTIITDKIYSFVNDEWNKDRTRYGGKTKKNKKIKNGGSNGKKSNKKSNKKSVRIPKISNIRLDDIYNYSADDEHSSSDESNIIKPQNVAFTGLSNIPGQEEHHERIRNIARTNMSGQHQNYGRTSPLPGVHILPIGSAILPQYNIGPRHLTRNNETNRLEYPITPSRSQNKRKKTDSDKKFTPTKKRRKGGKKSIKKVNKK